MQDTIAAIFDDRNLMLRNLKKQSYESNMNKFRTDHGHYFDELLAELRDAEDKEGKAAELGREFADKVIDSFGGKVKNLIKPELDMFMIYYVFPAVLLTKDENADTLCTGLKNGWNEKFGSNISYADYDTLYNGFRTKIFGLF